MLLKELDLLVAAQLKLLAERHVCHELGAEGTSTTVELVGGTVGRLVTLLAGAWALREAYRLLPRRRDAREAERGVDVLCEDFFQVVRDSKGVWTVLSPGNSVPDGATHDG